MQIRLVKEISSGTLRKTDEDVWTGDVPVVETNPPTHHVMKDGKLYQFAFKLNGDYVFRETLGLLNLDNPNG